MFRAGLQRRGICYVLLAMEYVLLHLGVTGEGLAFTGQIWALMNKKPCELCWYTDSKSAWGVD